MARRLRVDGGEKKKARAGRDALYRDVMDASRGLLAWPGYFVKVIVIRGVQTERIPVYSPIFSGHFPYLPPLLKWELVELVCEVFYGAFLRE